MDKLEFIVKRRLKPNEVELINNGSGDRLVSWNVEGVKQPTQTEIDAVSDSDAKSFNDLRRLRGQRDKLIAETDWWVLPDRTPTDAQKKYRQDLRDITKSATSLDDVTWPTKP